MEEENLLQELLPRQFKEIILTLENCLLPENKLEETPSQRDGLDKEIETYLRILGCEFIQIAGILLKLPQIAIATGQVLFQRFYYSKSYLRYSMNITAMSCIYLASKIEEAPRRILDVINVFHLIKQVRGQKPITPLIDKATCISLQNQIIRAEMRVLSELGYCVHVKHPHKLIVMYLQVLGHENNQRLMQMAWNFMNDSLRTDVFVRFNPESIACACISLAARKISLPLPNNPTWYGVFNVNENDILDIAYKIMDLYRRPKPSAEVLDRAVDKIKTISVEIRNKNRAGQNTPPTIIVDRNDESQNGFDGLVSPALPSSVAKEQQQTTITSSSDNIPENDSTNQPDTQSEQDQQQDNIKENLRASREKQMISRPSRSTSNSQSPRPNRKAHRTRSRSRSLDKHEESGRKRSKNHSRSVSLSPPRHLKNRNSRGYSNRKQREHNRDNGRERDRVSRHDRYNRGHRSHRERSRDRKR